VSLLGDYIAFLAVPLFVLDLTGSGADLGLTTAFETLPTLLFGFAAGVVLDRVSIRRALIVADVARAIAFGLLALSVAAGAPRVWMVFLAAFLAGSMSVVFDSGLQAWLPALLPRDALVTVNSRLQYARTVTWTLGPPLGALLINSAGGFAGAFVANAATFLISAVFVLVLVEIRSRPREVHVRWWPSFREGIAYLWREPRLRTATAAATVWNLTFIPMEALLVKFAAERLDIVQPEVGWFFGGHALLGGVGVVLAPRLVRRIGLGRTFVLGLAALGAGFLTMTLAAPWIAARSSAASVAIAVVPAGLAVAGVSFANVAFFTLRQTVPPARLLGRVIAASRTLSWAGIPIGAAVGGVLGDAIGVASVYVAASTLLLLVAALLVLSPLWGHRGAVKVQSTDWLRSP
jgi:predicted MFS family arabinose efflux permease